MGIWGRRVIATRFNLIRHLSSKHWPVQCLQVRTWATATFGNQHSGPQGRCSQIQLASTFISRHVDRFMLTRSWAAAMYSIQHLGPRGQCSNPDFSCVVKQDKALYYYSLLLYYYYYSTITSSQAGPPFLYTKAQPARQAV